MILIKFKEYIKAIKKLIRTKSLVILRCPYCDSIDLHYFKGTLEEEESIGDISKKIHYGISCNNCDSVAMIYECWNDTLRKGD
ncbi:MAG: hypothetical protein ACRCTZ_22550 [Sarcina sp.]